MCTVHGKITLNVSSIAVATYFFFWKWWHLWHKCVYGALTLAKKSQITGCLSLECVCIVWYPIHWLKLFFLNRGSRQFLARHWTIPNYWAVRCVPYSAWAEQNIIALNTKRQQKIKLRSSINSQWNSSDFFCIL